MNKTTLNPRPLFLDFDLYTDGDEEFKQDLVKLMVENLNEILGSLHQAYKENAFEIFEKVVHKIRPTISMLDDKELTDTIEEIKFKFSMADKRQELVSKFDGICEGIIVSLEREIK